MFQTQETNLKSIVDMFQTQETNLKSIVDMLEWLRRQTWNLLGFTHVGSNWRRQTDMNSTADPLQVLIKLILEWIVLVSKSDHHRFQVRSKSSSSNQLLVGINPLSKLSLWTFCKDSRRTSSFANSSIVGAYHLVSELLVDILWPL